MERLFAWLLSESQTDLWTAGLVAARVAPLTIFAPWLSLKRTPPVLRATLIFALTLSFAPLAAANLQFDPSGIPAVAYGGWLLREALVGTLFAVATAMPLYALDWAGRLVDTWRGASLAEVIAPNTGERTSPVGDLYMLMGIALFVTLGGHRAALAAFAQGLVTAPIGQTGFVHGASVLLESAELTGSALSLALAIAAPAAAAIVVVEVALGLLARSAPQVPVFFAGMPLRAAAGIGAMLLGLSLLMAQLPDTFRAAIDVAGGWLERL